MVKIFESGHTTNVFAFKVYSIERDDYIKSSRLATRTAIESINGITIGSAIAIPNEDLIDEFTEKGYVPKPS